MEALKKVIHFWEAQLESIGPILSPDLCFFIRETVKYLKELRAMREKKEVEV